MLLRITGRLIVHAENLSNGLYHSGELKQGDDGEPKLALAKLVDLQREVRINLVAVYGADGADGDDPLAKLLEGRR